jgi:hypothetical protein
MTFRVLRQQGLGNAQSPFRVIEDTGREVAWVNLFLDQERVRCVADTTLRSYAYDLPFLSRICGVILVQEVVPSCDKGQFP